MRGIRRGWTGTGYLAVAGRRKWMRRAAVAVELAVMAPVMFAMLFGIIEFGWLFSVRNTLINAAREGARLGALQGVTAGEIEARVTTYLEPMGLETHATIDVVEPTTEDPIVTVTVRIPQADVSLVGDFFGFTLGTIEGVASMRREGM